MARKDGFKVRMQADDVVDMEFYGVIGGFSFFEDDDYVDAPKVLKALKDMGKVKTLRMFYNSPGGDAYDGFQIANRLAKLQEDGVIGEIEAHAEGMVASAATLPFLVATKRVMRTGSRFMIHKPWSFGGGNAAQMRSQADRLDQTEKEAIDLYEVASSLTRDEIAEAMAADDGGGTYYSPSEAKAVGFATEVIEPFAIAACMSSKARSLMHKGLPNDVTIKSPEEQENDEKTQDMALHPSNW